MTENRLMGFAELARSLGARRFSFAGRDGGFSSVCTDSRKAEPGSLFVALRGRSDDGHRFVEAAFGSGAAGALVEEAALEDRSLDLAGLAENAGRELVVVENTLCGLQNAARAYLDTFPGLLRIGITGSSGKTTVKEIAAKILSREKKVVMNEGNLNSETGLPLSVFAVRACHEAGIFEMGMNRRGEIEELARVLRPHIALVTGVGTAHIGILGSRDAIAEEKKNIFSQFGGDERALIPADDEYRDVLARDVRGKVIFYGRDSFAELGAVRDLGLEGAEITWEGEAARFALPGPYNVRNVFGALAIAKEAPVSGRAVREGLALVRPLFGRGEVFPGSVTVIRDCYNANPESVAQVLAFCDGLLWKGRRVYVIGSMLELGNESEEAHGALGRLLSASGADMVFLFGVETETAAAVLEEGGGVSWFHTNDFGKLSRALEDYVRPGDLVLLKGSRGCALERLSGVLVGGAA
ncbi:MAG: UDP-N-acetylmuramoyl-tripeptide--D-alanyl-D-alanine ligase [Treponema sp.]|jgi:UDP-N-acetylmuramoyl-tripeptide--D-alanyl-D-alanine ligase|nr:UDP-N-acetylmuramoyl-tripeptide--D-alanyl-D-alanine ligase [Treponema sp.]